MKAITVAMEVTPTGDVVKEAFTMVHEDIDKASKWCKDLPKQFASGAYKRSWQGPRIAVADAIAIAKRGNTLQAQSYLFG